MRAPRSIAGSRRPRRCFELDKKIDRKPSTLSGGEQQRVALGRSLIRRPKILLLDEPLTNLDAKLRHDMRAELKRLHRQFGLTIVYATPDELEALSMGEEIAVMRDGGVVQIGTPDELYEAPRDLYVAGKIGSPHMNMIKGKLASDGAALESAIGPLRFCAQAEDGRSRGSGRGRHPAERHPFRGQRRAGRSTPASRCWSRWATSRWSRSKPAARRCAWCCRNRPRSGLQPGQQASVVLDPSKFHIFRASSGQAIA